MLYSSSYYCYSFTMGRFVTAVVFVLTGMGGLRCIQSSFVNSTGRGEVNSFRCIYFVMFENHKHVYMISPFFLFDQLPTIVLFCFLERRVNLWPAFLNGRPGIAT